jgi:transcriptional regulator with XRE-family HTH domain
MANNKVKMRRKARRITLEQLSELSGYSVSYLSRIESGKRQLNEESAAAIAAALKCSPAQLMGNGVNLIAKNVIDLTVSLESKVYLLGDIQAGAPVNIHSGPADLDDFVTLPNADRLPRFALRVVGDSMNLVARNGDIVICVKYMDLGHDPQPGDYVIVQHRHVSGLTDATMKKYVVQDGQVYLVPESSNPAHQAPISIQDNGEDNATVIWAKAIEVIKRL